MDVESGSTETETETKTEFGDTLVADAHGDARSRAGGEGGEGGSLAGATKIGRFDILGKIGEGGMGVVLLGYDGRLDRKLAIKLVHVAHATNKARARMLREAQALARVSHPNVVQIYECGRVGDNLYIAMEFVDGPTLRAWLDEQPRTIAQLCRVFGDAGRGLAAAHDKGLVHRDFKPDNVMIGSDGRVRVMDFGLVRTEDGDDHWKTSASIHDMRLDFSEASGSGAPGSEDAPTITATGAQLGTPAYMSPEQHRGLETDARTDQFSFCVTMWEALYEERPFAGSDLLELNLNVLSGNRREPVDPTLAPAALRTVLERGLDIDAGARWPTMELLIEAIERSRRPRRRRPLLALLAVAVASLGALAAYSFWPRESEWEAAGFPDEVAWRELEDFVRDFDRGDYATAAKALERSERMAPDSAAAVFWRANFEHTLHDEVERVRGCSTHAGALEGSPEWQAMADAACRPNFGWSDDALALLEPKTKLELPLAWLPLVVSEHLIPRIDASTGSMTELRAQAELALDRLDRPEVPKDGALGPPLEVRRQLARFELRVALGRFDAAREVLREILDTHPEAPILQARAAQYFALTGDLTRAQELAAQVNRYDPGPSLRLLLDAGRLQDAQTLIQDYETSPFVAPIQARGLRDTWCGYAYRFELHVLPEQCSDLDPGLVHNLWIGARADADDTQAMRQAERALIERQARFNAGTLGLSHAGASLITLTIPPFETYIRQLDVYATVRQGTPGEARDLANEMVAVAPGDPWALLVSAYADAHEGDEASALIKRRRVLARWREADPELPLVDSVRKLVEAVPVEE